MLKKSSNISVQIKNETLPKDVSTISNVNYEYKGVMEDLSRVPFRLIGFRLCDTLGLLLDKPGTIPRTSILYTSGKFVIVKRRDD